MELLVAVSILGILTTIALPNYTRSICKTKQSEVIGEISMIKTAIMGYTDERGSKPTKWEHINEIIPVLTLLNETEKTQASGELKMDNPQRMRNNNYDLTAEEASLQSPTVEIEAKSINSCPNFDIKACINTQTGVTDIEKGSGSAQANSVICS